MPPIDPLKIQAQVDRLNAQESNPEYRYWFAADGYHALTEFIPVTPTPIFNPSNGVPIKVFENRVTGEIKIYDSRIFRVTT